jgi:hypothetical protein
MLAALGQFVFALDNLAYEEMRRNNEWRHPENSRVGAEPARQFVGKGAETMTLSGLQAPEHFGDRKAIDKLRAMGDTGAAFALVNGAGEIFGAWVILSIEETGTLPTPEGVARRVEFSINLARVADVQADPTGGAEDGDGDDPQDWGDDLDWLLS